MIWESEKANARVVCMRTTDQRLEMVSIAYYKIDPSTSRLITRYVLDTRRDASELFASSSLPQLYSTASHRTTQHLIGGIVSHCIASHGVASQLEEMSFVQLLFCSANASLLFPIFMPALSHAAHVAEPRSSPQFLAISIK